MLSTCHWLGVGERREGLVALCGQEQPFEVAAKAIALIPLPEESIELLAVGFEGTRGGGNGGALRHGCISSPVVLSRLLPQQTTDKTGSVLKKGSATIDERRYPAA
jgi:hypothetical protein